MRKILIFICFLFVLGSCGMTEENNKINLINEDEINEKLEIGALLIDVRTQSEYDEGHIPNAILISVDDIESKISSISDDLTTSIIVYCRSGNRSLTAVKKLVELGYENVYDFGAISNWSGELEK